MANDCRQPIDWLETYVDDDLAPDERRRIEAHVATCATCRSRLAGPRKTTMILRAAPAGIDEPALVREIQSRLRPSIPFVAISDASSTVANGRHDDGPLVASAFKKDGRNRRVHRGWLKPAGQFVAAGLAFAIVASLLVVLFHDSPDGDGSNEQGTTGSPSTGAPLAVTDAPVRIVAWANDTYGDGAFKVVVGDTIGTTPSKLMPGPFFEDMSRERSPVWSPDGSMMVLVTDRDGNDELYAVSGRRPGTFGDPNATGLDVTGPRNITNDPGSDSDPVWSPDSRWIAFTSRRQDNLDIYLTQAGSAEATRLTTSPGADSDPAWSPDGQQIAYRSERRDGSGAFDIVVMNADGSNPRRVSAGDGVSSSPVWSPDGQQIAYTTILYSPSDGSAKRIQTNVVNQLTQETRTLADDPYPIVEHPSQANIGWESVDWSPDGTLVAFPRPVSEQFDIALASPDGSSLTMLTSTLDRDEIAPQWSPESLQLLYMSLPLDPAVDNVGSTELRLIDRDGANNRRIAPLTVTAATWSRPAWGPLASEAGELIPDTPSSEALIPTATLMPATPTPTVVVASADVCGFNWQRLPLDVVVMNADGSQQRLLGLLEDLQLSDPSWSPDGRSIVAQTGGGVGIVVFSMDSLEIELTINDEHARFISPIWSPDGSQIAYVRTFDGEARSTIEIVSRDGSDPRVVTTSEWRVNRIAWSPDGTMIAYEVHKDDVWNIHTIAVDGSDQRQITASTTSAERPTWSADGSRIRYQTRVDRSPGYYTIEQMEVDLTTGETIRLEMFDPGDVDPAWSPDDRRIVFEYEGDIWSMAADGSDRRNLTQHPVYSTDPAWSPDGQRIVFLSHRVHWPLAHVVEGQPASVVLWYGDAAQEGGAGRLCRDDDGGMIAFDVVGVVVPAEPLVVAQGATVDLVLGALGTPVAVSVEIYDLTVAEQLGQLQDGTLVPPCRPDEGCQVQSMTLAPALTQSLPLDLPPGRYVLAVRINYESTTGRGYSEQGFSVVIE